MILLTLSRGKGEETVRLQLPASPAEIGETFAFLDRISLDTALTVEQGVRFLESHILPHQNRSILKNRADEIAMQFQSVLAKNNRQGIRTQAEKKEVASAWLELAISCAKVPVKYEADEIKRRQKEEKTQRETEPVMA